MGTDNASSICKLYAKPQLRELRQETGPFFATYGTDIDG